eukprot:CAMPEP_0198307638 /NCGR_PEP_ID=MMETSP1450-20131203/465_1 /TAXON_ID=753684 ORGANISM="Madagascaria erythrocladiodes, Strain CCMP3234" /NCGR_SAMPLE_ID=MMETSP1450 /ASSEMBLY_ACC=CAM_ASM_001115 /LENGTH=266 /DNA_ID=CAMNT_0044010227 /DNA_START=61 /DNA_END=861 /DNA_ORIENTATION=+
MLFATVVALAAVAALARANGNGMVSPQTKNICSGMCTSTATVLQDTDVTVTGLPEGGWVAGQSYTMSFAKADSSTFEGFQVAVSEAQFIDAAASADFGCHGTIAPASGNAAAQARDCAMGGKAILHTAKADKTTTGDITWTAPATGTTTELFVIVMEDGVPGGACVWQTYRKVLTEDTTASPSSSAAADTPADDGNTPAGDGNTPSNDGTPPATPSDNGSSPTPAENPAAENPAAAPADGGDSGASVHGAALVTLAAALVAALTLA